MSEILPRFYTPSDQARIIEQSHRIARTKGWWPLDRGKAVVEDIHEKAVLIISELAEAFEDYRNPKRDIKEIYAVGSAGELLWEEKHTTMEPMPKPDGFPVEMADAYIRIADLAGALEITEMPELLINTDGEERSMGKIIYDIKECGGPLSGLRVSFIGKLNKVPWVKMVDSAPGYPTGQAFPYKLKWVDWLT